MLWLEGHKHELNTLGFATLQSWKYRIDLMSGRRHHYEIIGGFLVQLVGDAHLGSSPVLSMLPWSRCNCWSRRESGRAITVASWPARASWYANVLPILPAPITAIDKGDLAAGAIFFMTPSPLRIPLAV